jgi:hypothetical protein
MTKNVASSGDVYIHPACHPNSPLWLVLSPAGDRLRIECAECGELVGMFHHMASGNSSFLQQA